LGATEPVRAARGCAVWLGAFHSEKSKIFVVAGAERMWDTYAVDLRVNLPRNVAAEVEEVQRNDPELLSRIVYYAVTRRTIFNYLSSGTCRGVSVGALTTETE
jgi:hypothetical protein